MGSLRVDLKLFLAELSKWCMMNGQQGKAPRLFLRVGEQSEDSVCPMEVLGRAVSGKGDNREPKSSVHSSFIRLVNIYYTHTLCQTLFLTAEEW